MSQLLLSYWISTGLGFVFIIGSALLGHLHGTEEIEGDGDSGDVDGGGDDPGDADSGGDDPGDVDGSADGGDGDTNDPGDVDSGDGKGALIKSATTSAPAAAHKQGDRSLRLYLKIVGFFSPTKLALFFFFAGATGILTLQAVPVIGQWSMVPAIIIGYSLAQMMLNFLSFIMTKLHSSTNFKQDSLIGSVGELSLSIQPGTTGEILIATRGSRHSAPAKATDPAIAIKSLSKVIINDYRNGVFYVEPVSSREEIG